LSEQASDFASVCVTVNNIDRVLYVALAPDADLIEAVEELDEIRKKYKITQFMTKAVEKSYAFEEPGVKREKQKFIKIKYPAKGK
jgi:DNA polymerase alpha subunit A